MDSKEDKADQCYYCYRKFTWRFRKHPCRLCNHVFCNQCSLETTTTIHGVSCGKVRLCNKCDGINQGFNKDLERNQPLLLNQLQDGGKSSLADGYFDIVRRESELRANMRFGSDEVSDKGNLESITSEDSQRFDNDNLSQEYQRRLSQVPTQKRGQVLEDIRSDLAQKSTQQQNIFSKYLKANHYTDTPSTHNPLSVSDRDFGEAQKLQTQKIHQVLGQQFDEYLEQMVQAVMRDAEIPADKWFDIMHESTRKTALTVKPSSVRLNDSIDVNEYIKIVTVEHPTKIESRYVNGVIFKKDIANRRMRSKIEQPKILLLANSLGYAQEEGEFGGLVDLGKEIEQEDNLVRIISQQIAKVNPDVIFVEKDATRLVLDMCMQTNRTVVTNTTKKMMAMIARCTQTVICPNSNFISKELKIGHCSEFRIEQTKGIGSNSYQAPLNLLIIEGTQPTLGCSVVLSGPDSQELKKVRHALKKCIELARSLSFECEYLKFIKPQLFASSADDKEDVQEMDFGHNSATNPLRYSLNALNESQAEETFLFDKMMERQSLIFEHFSLAFPQKKQNDFEEVKERNDTVTPQESEKAAEADNEDQIKRKLKKMCTVPQRKKIDFYQRKKDTHITDISLFTMVRRLAKQSITNCKADQCFKSRLAHTDYWYHGNGCVEIKFKKKEGVDDNLVKRQLEEQQQVTVYAFCYKCNCLVIKEHAAPQEILEMSFYKFLEQFFYNQRLSTVNINAKGQTCRHKPHTDYSIQFRYGPIKIIFKFEQLDEYTLDLIHFGLTPGVQQNEQKQRAETKCVETMLQLKSAAKWIEDYIEVFFNWCQTAFDELPVLLNPELEISIKELARYMATLVGQFREFQDQVGKKFFSQGSSQHFTLLAQKVTSQTQNGRIATLISQRLSEYLFILRKVQIYITETLLRPYLPKKQSPQQFMNYEEDIFVAVKEGNHSSSFVGSVHSSAADKQQRAMSEVRISSQGERDMNEMMSHTKDKVRIGTMLETVMVSDQISGPSQQLKLEFKKIFEFKNAMVENKDLQELISYCAALPMGYNQGAVRVQPDDLMSMIAFTLNSNLYLSGLLHIDYMEMNEQKVVPFNLAQLQDQRAQNKSGNFISGALPTLNQSFRDTQGQNVTFLHNQDVLNQHVPYALAEAELSKPTGIEMIFDFSTQSQHQMILKLDKDNEVIISDDKRHKQSTYKHFFDPKDAMIDLGPLEQALLPKFYQELEKIADQHQWKQGAQANAAVAQPQKPFSAQMAYTDIYHLFDNEQVEFSVKIYFPGHFEALRKIYCGAQKDFIEAFCTTQRWKDVSGGKSRSTFFQTQCQKYVIKIVKGSEIKMFEEMSQSYFEYLKESFSRQCPTTIAKTLGIFKIKIQKQNQLRSESFYLLVMESLLVGSDEDCVRYDLKGSRRNRYITKNKDQPNQVTLDFNFQQDLKSRPIPLQYQMKRILSLAVHNDALYLSKQSVIDYSMFVIVNHRKKTVRLGIIDYIQTYTIEKQIESYLKAGIASEEPTIISPEAYKIRFRSAMDKYFIAMMPDRDQNMSNLMKNLFRANDIKWFTKETDKSL